MRLEFAMVITGLERPVLQAFGNEKRMLSTLVVLKRWRLSGTMTSRHRPSTSSPELPLKSIKCLQKLKTPNIFIISLSEQKNAKHRPNYGQ